MKKEYQNPTTEIVVLNLGRRRRIIAYKDKK